MDRIILHSDCNSFYASVECLHRPEIRDKPVAVGGDVEQRHGIILAKNELAKRYQIKTGEALWQAKQKCPELVIVPPRFELYQRFSRLCHEIYLDYTDQVEPFGLDECWLDVTAAGADGVNIAHEIRERIKYELGITVSIGVSYNKIFAKLGSDYKKPDAVTEISRANFKEIAWPLPAGDLLYVGGATRRKLESYCKRTIGDLANTPEKTLKGWFGKWGSVLYCFANGYDLTPVSRYTDQQIVKSIGNSTTTPRDLVDNEDVKIILYVLADSVARRLREHGCKGRTISISVRDNQLSSFTRQHTLSCYTNITAEIAQAGMELFVQHYHWQCPIRSIGINVSDLVSDAAPIQMDLYGDGQEQLRREKLDTAVDGLKRRFGTKAVRPAVLLTDPGLSGIDPKRDHTIHPVGYF
ncbi:DNA polymerase IV [Faecalispora jeddahensis]|uniref:Y-family DNA polymerase n=1 Tax=Faecalispora jeddahensis TaxID=1414721 RepID=UPI00189A4065|nr:DNA polymerase IV [Faecalispora jeddahensis]MDU6308170.1 DNA polymerase IV [Clostridium sp.]MDU6346415.1 DNA polymerase IV [Clostridium sp.]